MKHCHISIMCNELTFLKRKLPFLYKHFSQIIFVDYNIKSKSNSTDGSIEFIENFDDPDKKIHLVKNFNPDEIKVFKGESFIEKRKMFSKASTLVENDIDIVWATDLDEFFEEELISKVEEKYKEDNTLQSINLPHHIFVYNQYNYFEYEFYIVPRITKHKPGFIYGHCDFQKYGKTIKLNEFYLYHFAFVGLSRCQFKFNIYKNEHENWLKKYKESLEKNEKYIVIPHPNPAYNLFSSPYSGKFPNYLDIELMIKELENE